MRFIFWLPLVLIACSGPQGTQGPVGAPGGAGPQGPAGNNGYTPTITEVAATIQQCPTGGIVLTVTNTSSQGWTGATSQSTVTTLCNGQQGIPGLNGTNGTSVTPIQFCPGASNYPTTFLEYGLVIGGTVYGVYSANDGFWAYLPPGNYLSNAIGSICDFTINSDGSITH